MRLTALVALFITCSCGGKAGTHGPGQEGGPDGGDLGVAGSSSTPASDGIPPYDCREDRECEGHPCVEIYPGHKSCIIEQSEITKCYSEADECCSTNDCTSGKCRSLTFRHSARCDDRDVHNVCATDQCTPGSCGPEGACLPANVLGPVAMCIKAACQNDGDCDAEPGGICALVADTCCNGAYLGLFCWYKSRGCSWDYNCDLGFCGVAANGKDSECRGSRVCPE